MTDTGYFFRFFLDTNTDLPFPVLIVVGKYINGYFVCLPDFGSFFEVKSYSDIDDESFCLHMDTINGHIVASAVKHTINLLDLCYKDKLY